MFLFLSGFSDLLGISLGGEGVDMVMFSGKFSLSKGFGEDLEVYR